MKHAFSAWAGFMVGVLAMAALALYAWQVADSIEG
jgi:hypothetical protein